MTRWGMWCLVVSICAIATTPATAQLKLVPYVTGGLSVPVQMVADPTVPDVQYIVEQGGKIKVVKSGVVQATPFIDLTAVVMFVGDERGLLSMAFPPDYVSSRRFYVFFTNKSAITSWRASCRSTGNPYVADPSTRLDFVWNDGQAFIVKPFSNHNGAKLSFGPNDGYLYVGLGDGGSGDDPGNRAQNMNVLLGKMLRLDASVPMTDPKGYSIPPDNPFLDGNPVAGLGEIWDVGLRNPWRYSWDDPAKGGTGAMIIGDVGQSSFEEIDYEPADTGGRNYGWPLREGADAHLTTRPGQAFDPLTGSDHRLRPLDRHHGHGGYVSRGPSLGRRSTASTSISTSDRITCSRPCSTSTRRRMKRRWRALPIAPPKLAGPARSAARCRSMSTTTAICTWSDSAGDISKLALLDADGDGLPTDWELQFGLNPNSNAGNDGANGDPDGDGVTNAQEFANRRTRPRTRR